MTNTFDTASAGSFHASLAAPAQGEWTIVDWAGDRKNASVVCSLDVTS